MFTPFGSDALTVNGYLGSDGIKPLLSVCAKEDKGILCWLRPPIPLQGIAGSENWRKNCLRIMGGM